VVRLRGCRRGGRRLDLKDWPLAENEQKLREALEAWRLRARLDAADRRLRRAGSKGQ